MKKRIRKRDIFKYLTVPGALAMLWFSIYFLMLSSLMKFVML